jgi:hypothetical protein
LQNAAKEVAVHLINIPIASIGAALQPFFLKENIDLASLEIFKKEAISGKIFAEFTLDDVKEICPDMPYGHKKTVIKIRDDILRKENAEGPCLQILDQSPKTDKHDHYSDLDHDNPWQRLRELDTLAQQGRRYIQNALVRSVNLYKHNLIEPIHSFIDAVDTSEASLLNCIKTSFSMFVAACLTDRTNGIIHFGIREETDKDGEKRGKIIGFEANPSAINEMIYDTIKKSFFDDQLPIILQCVRPPQFVKLSGISASEQLYVVEIDVLPRFELTKYRTFYLRDANLNLKAKTSQQVLSVYHFQDARPAKMSEEQLKRYNDTKSEICDNRKSMEKSQSPFLGSENLSQQFLDLYSAGNRRKLQNEVYPVLILSPLDSFTAQPMSEQFDFLIDIDPVVIFDFQPTTASNGMFNVVEDFQNHTVKPYVIEDFDRKREDNIIHEVESNRQTLPGWVFCNGYEPLEMKPFKKLEWKTKRSESFKEAIRIYQDCIPNGRAFVIFAIFSNNYDIMLEVVEDIILKFQKQWIVLAEKAELLDKWKSELLRRSSVDEQTLHQRCIAGISWSELTRIVKEVKDIRRNSERQLPTSTGGFCYLKEKTCSELCDINILSRNECEESELIQDREKLETQKQKSEEEFYRGTRVSWWNMYFHKEQILERSQYGDIRKKMKDLLMGRGNEDDSKVAVFHLYHQPGCGGTTMAMHILWSLRKVYRCCIVRKITDDTHNQIAALRNFEDKTPKPPVVLIDNEDEIKFTTLRLMLERLAREASRQSEAKLQVYCLLFVCVRRVHLPDFAYNQSVNLSQRLDIDEINWLREKQDMLMKKHTENPSTGADPKTLIAFNLLKENFDKDYIERNANLYVDGVEDEKERKLLLYLSLVNTFDIEFQPIPMSAFDSMMNKNSGKKKYIKTLSMRREKNCLTSRHWEADLSTSLDDLLSKNVQVNTWGGGIQIVSKVFARAILLNMLKKEGLQLYETMCTFLKSTILDSGSFSITILKRIIQDILKKREVLANGKKEMFSPLVSFILKNEGGDRAAEVLECGFERTNDAMVAQQVARLYISLKNWEKAEEFAKKAVSEKVENSYLWDTYGQIYFKRLADVYERCLQDETLLTQDEIKSVVNIALKGISHFEKEQLLSEREQSDNDAGYFGELKTIVLVLDLFTQWNKDRENLHIFFVSHAVPHDYKIFQGENLHFLKRLLSRAENALTKLEDKFSQLKSTYRVDSNFNSALEVAKLRENLDTYFGEASAKIPKNLTSKEIASHCRRRINRIGGRSLVSMLRLRNEEQPDDTLEEIFQKAKCIINEGFASVHDYLTLLGVSLVRTIDSKEVDFESMLKWSKEAYKLATDSSKDDHPNLEAYMYFVIIHWPTERKRKYERHLCPPEEIAEAIRRWKTAFKKRYPRQEDANLYRKKETTYFFLGSGTKDIVYYEDLGDNSRSQDGDVFKTEIVRTRLQRLKGILLRSWEIKYQITSVQGNASSINITNSYYTSEALCNKAVYFYVGFSWNGPKAFYVTKEEHPETFATEVTEEQASRHAPSKRSRNEFEKYEDVSTHSKLSKALKDIDRALADLDKCKRQKGNVQDKETVSF